jgi:NAD(P)-dependent dehydrogenase (short-subunit alcohol dehydrogenase family)
MRNIGTSAVTYARKQPVVIIVALLAIIMASFLFGRRDPSLVTIEALPEADLVKQLKDKQFLIVGGTKGIGAALAKSLTDRGALVTVAGRSKSEETPEKAEFIKADVSSMKNAQELVQSQLKGRKFDTVVMTVGIITRSTLTRTPEGIEEDLAVSYLSRFVVLNELIKAKAIEGRKRVFIMGYPGEDITPTSVEDMNFETTPYKQFPAHFNTVSFNEALVHELARRNTDLHVFGLNPGLIRTGIRDNVHGGESSILGRVLETLIGWTNMNTDKYAERTLIPIMASPVLDTKTGTSFSKKGVEIAPAKWVATPGNPEKAWEASQALLNKVVPGGSPY